MKEKDVVSVLEMSGWTCSRDEGGDYDCLINVDDLQLQVFPSVVRCEDSYRISLSQSVSSRIFTDAANFIFGEHCFHSPVVDCFDKSLVVNCLTVDDILSLSEDIQLWGRAQNLAAGLERYRNLPTDSKGAYPLRHLAALAIAHDVERLEGYKQSFERGDRLGFVPYISLEMIERALLIARDERNMKASPQNFLSNERVRT